MPYYESVLIARQDISSQQVDSLTESLTAIIGENGGQVTKTEYWGLRNLAYRINKNRKGHYVLLNLDAPAGAVQEFERNMRINEDVLRYLTIKVEELEEGPSIQMQSRQAREERHRGRRDDRGGDRGDRGPRGGAPAGDGEKKAEAK
ncbi:MAG: 30S ribosomal protein S6 [Minwuiales bacterium]|nr:30S ribosomal protein S6 [Minwuiales bacterium]